jgi:hypothetical protein
VRDSATLAIMGVIKTSLAISGICTALAVILSAHQIQGHLKNWTHPREQKYILIILAMVPLYAVDSFIRCEGSLLRRFVYTNVFPTNVHVAQLMHNAGGAG